MNAKEYKDKVIEILEARRVRPPYEFIALGGNDEGYLLEIATRIDSLYQAKSREEAEAIDKVWAILNSDIPKPKFILALLEIKRIIKAAFGKEGEG